MLPFLKPQRVAGVIVAKTRSPEGGIKENEDDNDNAALHSAADDLIRAIHAKDTVGVAAALQAAFEIADSRPHEEGEHTDDDNSYDSQNAKAAQSQE